MMNKSTMQKRQEQLQKLVEELLPDNLDNLLKDALNSLDSAWDSAKDATKETAKDVAHDASKYVNDNVHFDRRKLEAMGRDALDSLDRDKLEKVVREALHSLDADKLEKWARQSLRSVDNDKLKRLLRDKLGGIDKDKLEDLLKDGMRHIDRRKLEDSVRDRIRSLDLDKIKSAARSSINDFDPQKIERFVNDRVDSVVRARLDALDADELEKLLGSKRAALAVEEGARKGKAAKKELKKAKDAKVTVKVEEENSSNPITSLLGTMGRFAVLGAVGWIAYSHLFLEHQVPLPKAIAAELLTLVYRPSGPINIYQDRGGSGRPLVLIHSVNAAASSYEMRPLFQHYRGNRPVFALDLPGFGFSARPNIEYTPEIYVNAIIALLAGIGGEAADVVALSLGSEFAAEAARRRPELFHSLSLISPSGMYQNDSARSSQSASAQGFDKFIYPLLSFRLWSRPFFDLLTTRQSIQYFLQRSFVGSVPDGMVDYSIATSHQPGAEHAPLYFVSGKLFTPNALDKIYRQVTTPSLVIYDQDAFVRFDRLPELLATNKAWQATRVSPTLGLPHWEKLDETVKALDTFWESIKVTA